MSARPSWSRAAPAGPCTRGTLTGDAVDLVALDGGEVSWQWEDYFRIAAAMQARRASSE